MRPVTQSGTTSARSSHGHLRVVSVRATRTAKHEAVAAEKLTARERVIMGTAAIVAPIGVAANVLYALLG